MCIFHILSFDLNLNRKLTSDLCIGQVRCIFSLPHAIELWFPGWTGNLLHKHLAYVEWFTTFSRAQKNPNSKLFKVSRLMVWGERCVSIIPISLILSSIQLFPKFGPQAPVSWSSSNVLDKATACYVNPFSDRFLYLHISQIVFQSNSPRSPCVVRCAKHQ